MTASLAVLLQPSEHTISIPVESLKSGQGGTARLRVLKYGQMQSGLHISLAAERLGTFWGLPITNSLVMSWAVMGLLMLGAWLVGRSLRITPGPVQNFFEMLMEYMTGIMDQIFGSKALTKRYFP